MGIVNRPIAKVDQDYQIHLCKSRVYLWLKILASALRARGLM